MEPVKFGQYPRSMRLWLAQRRKFTVDFADWAFLPGRTYWPRPREIRTDTLWLLSLAEPRCCNRRLVEKSLTMSFVVQEGVRRRWSRLIGCQMEHLRLCTGKPSQMPIDYSMRDSLLISVKPRFSEGILDGSKTVELRRLRPNLIKGDTVYLYSTSPAMQISGCFIVDDLIAAAPQSLWGKVGPRCGVSEAEFANYFQGCGLGYAIVIAKSHRIKNPIGINQLRKIDPKFHPLQGYLYLKAPRLITPYLIASKRAA